MANGPPTPPPTTDAEIQDAARDPDSATVAPTPSASTATPPTAAPKQPQVDVFQNAFTNRISPLAAAAEWEQLMYAAEFTDAELASEELPTRLLVVAPLVLTYLINDQLPQARFALHRLSTRQQRLTLASALHKLIQATADRHHSQVYACASEVPVDGDISGTVFPELGNILPGMVAAFCDAFRMRTFLLLSKAYSEISLSLAQTYLGLTEENLLSAAEKFGWKYDAQTQILSPIERIQVAAPLTGVSTLGSFDFVATSVSRLEL